MGILFDLFGYGDGDMIERVSSGDPTAPRIYTSWVGNTYVNLYHLFNNPKVRRQIEALSKLSDEDINRLCG
jgi:hypothetical protein